MPRTGSQRKKPQKAPQRPEAVLYARVSSRDQEREGYSIPAQQKLLKAYAKDKDITIVREFQDVETAKQVGRRECSDMALTSRYYLVPRESCCQV